MIGLRALRTCHVSHWKRPSHSSPSAKWQQPEPTGVTRVLDLVALVTLVQILVFFLILVTLVLDSSSSLLLFSRLSIPVLKLATMCYFCKSSS